MKEVNFLTAFKCLLLGLFFSSQLIAPNLFAQDTHTVIVKDFEYDPPYLPILEGDTVRFVWSNDNLSTHDVIAGEIESKPATSYQRAFTTALVQTGFSFDQTFDAAFLGANPSNNDNYRYFCSPHQAIGMVGTIAVLDSARTHSANLSSWQLTTDSASAAQGSCNLTVASDDSSITLNCSHSVSGATTAAVFQGAFGADGAEVCSFSANNINNQSCAAGAGVVESLLGSELYIVVRSASFPNGEIRGQFVVEGGSADVEGVVRNSFNSRIEGVTIQAAGVSGTSDILGTYTLSNVPNGAYQLVGTVNNGTVEARSGTNPVLVNNVHVSGKDFVATVNDDDDDDDDDSGSGGPGDGGSDTDTDGDGVTDSQEETDGSNPNDRGSYKDNLTSPLYVVWNGFLRMTNVLELINTGTTPLTVDINFYDISGNLASTTERTIPGRGQTDVIVNDLDGFVADSYGVIGLEFSNDRAEDIEGRMFFYRSDLQGGYEFAFGVPFVMPTMGVSSVGFNTYQPSINALDAASAVLQWLAIVNLDSVNSRSFTIRSYDLPGNLLDTRQVVVPPFGRIDLSAGHVNPGPSNVGQHIITPDDVASPYIAQLFRYGSDAPATSVPSRYFFAFPLLSRPGNGETQYAPISIGGGSDNWLELVNTQQAPVNVDLSFYDNHGMLKNQQTVSLGAFAQQHIHAASYLDEMHNSGTVTISPSVANSVVGTSMFYFRDDSGSIEAMYGSPVRETFGRMQFGSYNLFIGMNSWLKLANVSGRIITAIVRVYSSEAGLLKEMTVPLDVNGGVELAIHDASQFNTTINTYGVIEIETAGSEEVFSEVLRLRPTESGDVDFAAPTSVR